MLLPLLLSVPVLRLLDLLVARQARTQPFWLLAVSFAALPSAALVASLGRWNLFEEYRLQTILGRSLLVADFQHRLEILFTEPFSCLCLLLFLLLWAVCGVLGSALPDRADSGVGEGERAARVTCVLVAMVTVVLLGSAFGPLGKLKASLAQSGFDVMPDRERVSFSHPALQGKRYLDLDEVMFIRGFKGEGLLSVVDSVTSDLVSRRFETSRLEGLVIWRLFHKLDSAAPTNDPRSARFVATVLAYNRHWDLGCTEELTASFRSHTLSYLASSKLSGEEERFFQQIAPYLKINDQGGRERQDLSLLRRVNRGSVFWGRKWNTSLGELYYALENTHFSPHGLLSTGFNPELEALEAIIEIRKRQESTGEFPASFSLSEELGEYRRLSPGRAEIVLRESDPLCRPATVVEFGGVGRSD